MNHLDLSQCLATVSEFVPESTRLADIESDHTYLPITLMLKGKIKYVAAGEVVQGLHESAHERVREDGLEDRITAHPANGLDAIQPQDAITATTITGVGGLLIREILETGKLHQRLSRQERLIPQSNIGERTLRSWLQENQYKIQSEKILEENKKMYEIIAAEREQKPVIYNEMGLMFRPFLLEEKNEIFKSKWTRELQQRKAIREQLKQAANQEACQKQVEQEIQMVEEALEIWQ